MSSERNDGGPAFPFGTRVTSENYQGDEMVLESNQAGMSLRDWFAGHAMAAIIGRPITDYPDGETPSLSEVADDAFRYADAMIAERSKS